jgi:parallel beta-helix repeat protein
LIDVSQSTHFAVANGIVVQNGNGERPFESIEIQNNQIVGAAHSVKLNDYIVFAGILVRSASGVRIEGNYVQRAVRGILLDTGSSRIMVSGNKLVSCGSGSTNAIVIDSSTNNI